VSFCRAVVRGRARRRLAPTRWGRIFPVGCLRPKVRQNAQSCRGQALPDPSGPPGPATHANGCRGAMMTTAGVVGSERPGLKPNRSRPGGRGYGRSADRRWVSCGTCRPQFIAAPVARAGEAAPRPDRDAGVNPRSACTCRGRSVCPALVGVRRCLTRPASGAGRPSRRRSSGVPFQSPCAGVCRGWPRPWRGRARQRLAPTNVAWCIPGRAFGCDGWVQPPSGRGQAVPDPSGPSGPATHTDGCRGAVMTTVGAVGSERPGLKPFTAGRSWRGLLGWSALRVVRDVSATRNRRACGAGGRGGASPRQGGPAHPRSGRWAPRWGDPPHPVGVRRFLTRRLRGLAIP
jgi:hypothetical protein